MNVLKIKNMKFSSLAILFLFTLSASTCKKEGSDCHYNLTVLNNTNDTIICALKFYNYYDLCQIGGPIIEPNGSFSFTNSRSCWENRLSDGRSQEFYIVDPNHYDTSGVFYDCDSIEMKNTVLKHYILTLEDLQNNDFGISYP